MGQTQALAAIDKHLRHQAITYIQSQSYSPQHFGDVNPIGGFSPVSKKFYNGLVDKRYMTSNNSSHKLQYHNHIPLHNTNLTTIFCRLNMCIHHIQSHHYYMILHFSLI